MKAPEVPVWALVHLTHAGLQRIADEAGVDLLHIKGPAISTMLRLGIHDSTDADVLVRPAHVDRMIAALTTRGWEPHTDFDEGSPFAHAANLRHPSWTYADVHRRVPGCRAPDEAVFDRLWADRETAQIAHHPCQIVSTPAQVALQAMHAARSHGHEQPESWILCPDELRPAVRDLVADLQATTAFAAGIGELAQHRNAPDHALWTYWSSPNEDRLDEWAGRLRAASGAGERVSVLRQALRVNRTHLRLRLDREPTASDVAREQLTRVRVGLVSLWRHLRARRTAGTSDAGARTVKASTSTGPSPAAIATEGSTPVTSAPAIPVSGAEIVESASSAELPGTDPAPARPAGEIVPAETETSVNEVADSRSAKPSERDPHHVIAPGVAWLDATDAGRADPVAWTARLDTAELHELPRASWMVWTLIAEGVGTADGIRAEIAALEATIDFGDEGLDGFLARLRANGLIVTTEG